MGKTGAGVKLFGGGGVPNGIAVPIDGLPCGPAGPGPCGAIMTGPEFPWESE